MLNHLVLEERALLRVACSCKVLHGLALAPALWQPALLRFFDGELPHALVECDDPLRELRTQGLHAQSLIAREREKRHFQVPDVNIQGSREWMKSLDARVAEAQIAAGQRNARPGRGGGPRGRDASVARAGHGWRKRTHRRSCSPAD